MLQKMTRTNEKGFTLIELMIVIAIIGILAAIAIPNFIAYRNKAFCSAVESDANAVAAALSSYFAIPSHIDTPTSALLVEKYGLKYSGDIATLNSGEITGTDPNANITITVTDGSGRCPDDYMNATPSTINEKAFWVTADKAYTKLILFSFSFSFGIPWLTGDTKV